MADAMTEAVQWWHLYVPGFVIVIAGLVTFRWLISLQRRITDLLERIARLEGRLERDDDQS